MYMYMYTYIYIYIYILLLLLLARPAGLAGVVAIGLRRRHLQKCTSKGI